MNIICEEKIKSPQPYITPRGTAIIKKITWELQRSMNLWKKRLEIKDGSSYN